ncbi:hypothetical protein V5799_010151 [Amblyomma americanum]|uniref:Uncharacterized protein n=1 Tax=Amblyomma americanum TaxID=6943 RepID=A0AAQ4F9T6_AMBAM
MALSGLHAWPRQQVQDCAPWHWEALSYQHLPSSEGNTKYYLMLNCNQHMLLYGRSLLRLPGVTIMTLKESNHPPREEPALVMNGETSVKSGACSGLSLASMALCMKSGHQNDKGVKSICYCTILQHLETSP